jgi:Ca2+-binding RTX toxin-like protein
MTAAIRGTRGDDNLDGTSGNDEFLLGQGGNDTVHAGDGNDIIRMGAALNAGDQIDGGNGRDVMVLNGDYSAGLVLNADTITNIEVLILDGGHSYNLTMNDGNVATGQSLLVKAGSLGSGDQLVFDGSAETDGSFYVVAGAGDDTITGGAQADHIHLENGGADTANGGGGNDTFYLGNSLWSDDQIDGGAGYDVVRVTGFEGGDGITFTSTTIQGVEDFILDVTTSLGITTDDATVAAGATMTFDASKVIGFFFDGSAETDGSFNIIAGAGDDELTGGAQADTFHLEKGGNDTVSGGGGNDHFYLGAKLTAADQIDGGAGFDTVLLDGGAAVVFGATTMVGVERMLLAAGHSYTLTMNDANVAAGEMLTIDASALGAGNRLAFQGSAETDGSFDIIGGAGNEIVSGGAQADIFHLEEGGNDTANGLGGNDTFYMGATFTGADKINGGVGTDTVVLDGMGDDAIIFNATTMTNVEKLVLDPGHFYTLVTDDATVAAGRSLTVDGSKLGAGDPLAFDGSAETDGSFVVFGGAGNDIITGGANADVFHLEKGGIDVANGGGGNDHIFMGASLTAQDQIDGGDGYDTVILNGGAAVTFSATTMTNVEQLDLVAGHSYSLTTNDATVAPGGFMVVDGSTLGAGDTLTLNASAETDGYYVIYGGAGNDVITGSQGGDLIDLSTGGNDTVTLGSAVGYFNEVDMGAALTAADHIDGTAGLDLVTLQGDYTGAHAVVFDAATMVDIEDLVVGPGFSYDLTSNDGNISAGGTMQVDGSFLGVGDSLKFDGSAETDGSFILIDGLGNDVLKGGAGNDYLSFDGGGTDTGSGGAGDDFIDACGHFDSTDQFDGGAGTDTIELTASDAGPTGYTGANALVLTATMMSNIEVMDLDNGGSYDITTVDANVAAGSSLTVDGSILDSTDQLTFDGSAETDGSFIFIAGANNQNHLTGGAGNDTFDLTGVDSLADTQAHGGGGNDTFEFSGNFDSSSQIIDGGTGTNTLSLDGDYSSISLVGSGIIDNIQTVTLAGGHSYTGIAVFDDVAGGGTLTFDATALQSGDAFGLDASASTNAIVLNAGDGSYAVTGSAQNDTFNMGATFTVADQIDGGDGTDTVNLDGDYTGGNALVFTPTTMTNVEYLVLAGGHSYDMTTDDANVTSGATLTVDASTLGAADTLTFDGSAETDGSFDLIGGAGDDVLTGGAGNDGFNLTQGGNDTAHGGAGNDTFSFGAAFTAADTVDGGANSDTISLNGDYSAGLTLGATTITSIENIVVQGGHDYNLTTDDANVASGATLNVIATSLGTGDTLTFDGSAETDGKFAFFIDSANVLANSHITGGAGNDSIVLNGDFSGGVSFAGSTIQSIENITLTAGHDYVLDLAGNSVATGDSITVDGSTLGAANHFYFSFDTTGGGDSSYVLKGGAGDDAFFMKDAFSASDKIDGGTGNDEIQIGGDYSSGVTFNDDTITNIDYFYVLNGNSYTLKTADGNVAAGQNMLVSGSGLTASDYLHFDGSAETDGSFTLVGGAGADILEGGNMGDTLTGGGGADTFLYTGAVQSTSTTYDTITDFAAGTDHFDLPVGVSGIFTASGSLDSGANFDSELAAIPGIIQPGGATILTVTGGTLSGHTFLVVDGNGDDIYSAGNDYVFDITGYTGTVTTGDFI